MKLQLTSICSLYNPLFFFLLTPCRERILHCWLDDNLLPRFACGGVRNGFGHHSFTHSHLTPINHWSPPWCCELLGWDTLRVRFVPYIRSTGCKKFTTMDISLPVDSTYLATLVMIIPLLLWEVNLSRFALGKLEDCWLQSCLLQKGSFTVTC